LRYNFVLKYILHFPKGIFEITLKGVRKYAII